MQGHRRSVRENIIQSRCIFHQIFEVMTRLKQQKCPSPCFDDRLGDENTTQLGAGYMRVWTEDREYEHLLALSRWRSRPSVFFRGGFLVVTLTDHVKTDCRTRSSR